MKNHRHPWRPLPRHRLLEIIAKAEVTAAEATFRTADVYSLGREVESLRKIVHQPAERIAEAVKELDDKAKAKLGHLMEEMIGNAKISIGQADEVPGEQQR